VKVGFGCVPFGGVGFLSAGLNSDLPKSRASGDARAYTCRALLGWTAEGGCPYVGIAVTGTRTGVFAHTI
jgi:hypothetical protein